MDWDLTLEKLRREAFRPSVPPPVRLPRWAVATLVGAGLTLSVAACDRDGSANSSTSADMGRVHVEYGAPMPPEPADIPMDPAAQAPLYAAPPPMDPMPVEVPPQVEEYRAPPIMKEPIEQAPPMEEEMKTPVDPSINVPVYGPPPIRRDMRAGTDKQGSGYPPTPPPQSMYGGPAVDDF